MSVRGAYFEVSGNGYINVVGDSIQRIVRAASWLGPAQLLLDGNGRGQPEEEGITCQRNKKGIELLSGFI